MARRLERERLGGRSPLYRWLYDNRAEVAVFLGTESRPSWQAVAKVAKDNGLDVSRQSVQSTWLRIQRDLKSEAARPRVEILPPSRERPVMPADMPPAAEDVADAADFQFRNPLGRPIKP